jgi:hypothetical protein
LLLVYSNQTWFRLIACSLTRCIQGSESGEDRQPGLLSHKPPP